ncbi:hypothetical protein KFZ58_03955 [Virgibacillus sp. NKC19-16]|uniref:hypothetical protein n=1 Tax=Virgibacillus salidurans TaxID=2831673 RepID=UPI001F427B54|nr:hypothetical protein [Virgibacillus sp. NKC19-16]UJL47097.1 hypothetical protein KFZ58_03955 [Virgibacillus sp. NKC19-16]
MEWQKCPRCDSRRVGKRGNIGCMGIIIMIFLAYIITYAISSFLPDFLGSIAMLVSILIFPLSLVGLFKLREKFFRYLYCKDCELVF